MQQIKLDAEGVIVTIRSREDDGAVQLTDTFGRRFVMSRAEAVRLGQALIGAGEQP